MLCLLFYYYYFFLHQINILFFFFNLLFIPPSSVKSTPFQDAGFHSEIIDSIFGFLMPILPFIELLHLTPFVRRIYWNSARENVDLTCSRQLNNRRLSFYRSTYPNHFSPSQQKPSPASLKLDRKKKCFS